MILSKQVAPRDGLSSARTASPGHSRQAKTWVLRSSWAALLLVLAASGSVFTMPALAAGASPGAGPVSFFGDIGNGFSNKEPFLRDSSYFLVRPSQLLLTEDGSVDLESLRWSGWGTSVARATGEWRASDCTPSCATGKDTIDRAQLTLSSPGIVLGHLVYRCFRVTPAHPQRDILDQGCLHWDGTSYSY